LGKNGLIVIVVPANLPQGKLVLYVEKAHLRFAVGNNVFADVLLQNEESYMRLALLAKVGIVEYPPGTDFPTVITNVMAVRRGPPPSQRQ
jgi:hypothetical protein